MQEPVLQRLNSLAKLFAIPNIVRKLGSNRTMQFLKSLFGPKQLDRDAHQLYGSLIAQSRRPSFFLPPFNAPDDMEGRFEVIVMHMALLDHFLSGIEGSAPLRRSIQELLIRDMDRSLRELGIGDMSIGKQMKKVGAGMLGRLNSYETAIARGNKKETCDLVVSLVERNMELTGQNSGVEFANYFWKQLCSVNAINKQAWSLEDSVFDDHT